MWVVVLTRWILFDLTTIGRVSREGTEYRRCLRNASIYIESFFSHRSPAKVVYGPDRVEDGPEDASDEWLYS